MGKARGDRSMRVVVRQFVRDEEGQDLVEYAMLLAFIALICITAVKTLGTNVNSFFDNMATQLK
jgi:pilus assembly protein Flp/PilA